MSRTSSGFTLVEVLVVLAILGVLTALLLPVFNQARESGRRRQCANNLHQLGVAMQTYCQDYDSHYPIHYDGYTWYRAIKGYVKNQEVTRCPNQPSDIHYYYNFLRATTFTDGINHRESHIGIRESELAEPTRMIVLQDRQDEREVAFVSVRIPKSCGLTVMGEPITSYLVSLSHFNGNNYLFFDGHVKWLLPQAEADAECAVGPYRPPYA